MVPPTQWDPPTAVTLVNTLRRGGVEVEEALEDFTAGGTAYPAGSFVLRGAQAFRAYLRDLLRPQRYPERRGASGGSDRPYDITGWTLPLQMGVRVDEVSGPVNVRSRPVTLDRNETGRKTMTSDSVVESTAGPISRVPAIDACIGSMTFSSMQ